MEYDVEIESGLDDLLLREAAAQGLDSVPDCEGAIDTNPGGNGGEYPREYDYDPCETRATGYYGSKGWLCDQHASEAGVL